MSETQGKNKLPTTLITKLEPELGTMPDSELAEKYSGEGVGKAGFTIARHTIFWLRKTRKIPAYNQRPYTKPSFRGRLEDTYPEVKELLGKVPVVKIADKFGVSRSCVRSAADRLGVEDARATDFDEVFDAAEKKVAEAG